MDITGSIYTAIYMKNLTLETRLNDYFDEMNKKISSGEITYSEFNDYYKKYLETVSEDAPKFDYITNGTNLLESKVEATGDEIKALRKQRLELSKFIVSYAANIDMKPSEVYASMKNVIEYVATSNIYNSQPAPVVLQKVANR